MRKPFIAILALLVSVSSASAAFPENDADMQQRLRRLYRDDRYFDLRNAVAEAGEDAAPDLDFFRGASANAFNKLDDAATALVRYLEGGTPASPRPLALEAWRLLADTWRRSGRYRKAGEAYRTIIERYGESLDAPDKSNYENQAGLWSALAEFPPQTIEVRGDSAIRMENRFLPVRFDRRILYFAYDTGANLSVLYESAAKELGLALIGSGMKIQSGTGKWIDSRMAVVPELHLGEAVVRNAVFLVLPDNFFPVRRVRPGIERRGLIGAPILTALKEITETRDGKLLIPVSPQPRKGANMYFFGFIPIVEILHRGSRLAMQLDTGSSATFLHPPYFRRYRGEIQSHSKPRRSVVGGVGGERVVDIHVLPEFAFRLGDLDLAMKNIAVQTEVTHSSTEIFFGTLGLDILAQGSRMTFDFESMSFVLE